MMVRNKLINKFDFLVVKNHRFDLKLNDEKYLNINLYEIRLEEKIIDNKTLLDAFLFDCQCALFLVDMTNSKSLDLIKDIIVNIDNDKYPYLKKILVENKSDIKSENSNDELQQFINDNEEIEYVIISVKTGDNMDNLLDKIYNEVNSPDNNIPINKIAKTNLKEDFDETFSLILLGESSVGKTNFMMRYSLNIFETKFLSTYGLNRESKRV